MKKYIYLFTLIFIASLTQAQDIPFDKKIFKERKDEFKTAKKNLGAGNELYEIFPESYRG